MQNTRDFALACDQKDALNYLRKEFIFPQFKGRDVLYFTGNSLGLQPKVSQSYVDEVMNAWGELAVEGHFNGDRPWWEYHEKLTPTLSKIMGCHQEELTVMNTLSVNLHFLLVSFFRPEGVKTKILCEQKAFPSDKYIMDSQLRFRGLNPEDELIQVPKREDGLYHTEDFIQAIEHNASELALVFLGGVNYYNGQVFDIQKITEIARKHDVMVGWDLAHAAGNIELALHNWGVDFAAWCSYKYLNAGPGNASGVFIHNRHLNDKDIRRFEGWWGNKKETRFKMTDRFDPIPTADAWQVSNAPILSLAPFLASLTLFEKVGMSALIEKRDQLTGYLEFVLKDVAKEFDLNFEIITPPQRGAQLSIYLHGQNKSIFEYLTSNGCIPDWREPNVIRMAPVPMYNSFEDIYNFGQLLKQAVVYNS
ncbi:MAG: kynureninase [Flavobacteriaceae bacterium]|nr:kynureninase [Flavobacteriaceae bacterium]OUX39077.1 MAG: kynureninase [Flavobacteriaceae bacterium TMED265]